MAFLESLRSSSSRRPFGMPKIDSGNVSELFRDIIPLANSMNDQNMRRDKEMMEFEHTLRQPKPAPMSMTQKAYGGGRAPMAGSIAGPQSPGGNFSPMQRMFQQRDEEERGQKFKAGEMAADRAGKLQAVMEEARLRDTGETDRLGQTLSARREEGAAERGSRESIADKELAAKVKAAETERAARSAEGQSDRLSRERIAGMPARATAPSATQQGNQFENRIQQLAVENPEAHALITKDPDTGQFKFKGGTPEQQAWVKNYLSQQAEPTQSKPKMITQRNKRTGETRQVPVK